LGTAEDEGDHFLIRPIGAVLFQAIANEETVLQFTLLTFFGRGFRLVLEALPFNFRDPNAKIFALPI
jgi:hypothetical protein